MTDMHFEHESLTRLWVVLSRRDESSSILRAIEQRLAELHAITAPLAPGTPCRHYYRKRGTLCRMESVPATVVAQHDEWVTVRVGARLDCVRRLALRPEGVGGE